jgi:hypothetical protein
VSARSRLLATLVLGAGLLLLNEHIERGSPAVGADADSPAASSANPASTAELAPLEAFDPPPLNQFADFVERPPFLQSRRPPLQAAAVEAVPPEPAAAVAPSFTAKLLGVRIQPQSRAALFYGSAEESARWVTEGEIIDGWTVYGIDESGVYLRYADQPYELRLWPQ